MLPLVLLVLSLSLLLLVLVVASGFADLFSVKEDSEILNAKKAAFLASKVMQSWVVEKIEDIIDKNKKVKHAKLSGRSYMCVGATHSQTDRRGGQSVLCQSEAGRASALKSNCNLQALIL